MSDLLNLILSIGALILLGIFALFSFILAQYKKELWEENYDKRTKK